MRNCYETPNIEVVLYKVEDVITSSSGISDGGAGSGGETSW